MLEAWPAASAVNAVLRHPLALGAPGRALERVPRVVFSHVVFCSIQIAAAGHAKEIGKQCALYLSGAACPYSRMPAQAFGHVA
jgi:hypothetical protein